MGLVFHERVGLQGRRISPFSWRIRYALAHKRLVPEVLETRFADADRIRRLSRQHLTPIIEDDGTVVHETWDIACHLEDRYPDRPSLFGGPIGLGTTRLVNIWSDAVLAPALRPHIYADFIDVIDPADRAYFRSSREAMLGMTLEAYCADRDAALPALALVCAPLDRTLREQPFLAGEAPAYADYIVFSAFQYARVGSPRDVLALLPDMAALLAWRGQMIELFGGLGDRFGLHPAREAMTEIGAARTATAPSTLTATSGGGCIPGTGEIMLCCGSLGMITYDLSGKTALVIGGASGIGFATAKMLAGFGATVAVNFLADDPRAAQRPWTS